MFERASMKLGLDQAVLTKMETDSAAQRGQRENVFRYFIFEEVDEKKNQIHTTKHTHTLILTLTHTLTQIDNDEIYNLGFAAVSPLNGVEIDQLLRHGAYGVLKDDTDAAIDAFTQADITEILTRNTKQISLGAVDNEAAKRAATFSRATFNVVEPDEVDDDATTTTTNKKKNGALLEFTVAHSAYIK